MADAAGSARPIDRQLEHLVGEPVALPLVAAQTGQPSEARERQGTRVLGPDVLGQPRRLVGVGDGIRQPAVPKREIRAQAERVREETGCGALARQRDSAVERAQRPRPVAEQDPTRRGP